MTEKPESPERKKFKELANRRVVNAIKAIRALGKLDRHAAVCTDTDIRQMVFALQGEVSEMSSRLNTGTPIVFELREPGDDQDGTDF